MKSIKIKPFDIIEIAYERTLDSAGDTNYQTIPDSTETVMPLNKIWQDTTGLVTLRNNIFSLPKGRYQGHIYSSCNWTQSVSIDLIMGLYNLKEYRFLTTERKMLYLWHGNDYFYTTPNELFTVNFYLNDFTPLDLRFKHKGMGAPSNIRINDNGWENQNDMMNNTKLCNSSGIFLKRKDI